MLRWDDASYRDDARAAREERERQRRQEERRRFMLEDEIVQEHSTSREEKMELLHSLYLTTQCAACGSHQKTTAAILGPTFKSLCRDCGAWTEVPV